MSERNSEIKLIVDEFSSGPLCIDIPAMAQEIFNLRQEMGNYLGKLGLVERRQTTDPRRQRHGGRRVSPDDIGTSAFRRFTQGPRRSDRLDRRKP